MTPLDGLRVLDLTRVMAGPFCTALLADLGAKVIKLEPPQGDDYRHIGPFAQGESALFTLMNRGKQSIVLDLKDAKAQETARKIALQYDVIVENFRPGTASRRGLGPELRRTRPSLIYASISGFGQTGPCAHLPAYDLVAQAMSGLMAATGEEGGPPLKVGESDGDLMAGLYASWSILAALHQRDRTGVGATLDVAMFDALFSLRPTSHAVQFYAGREPQRIGNRHPLSTPFGCFATSDGQAVIAVLGDRQWLSLCDLIGQPDTAQDPRFRTDGLTDRQFWHVWGSPMTDPFHMLTDEERAFVAMLTTFCAREIAPKAAETDDSGAFVHAQIAALADLGLMGANLPAPYGPGLSAQTLLKAVEVVAGSCGSTASVLTAHYLATDSIACGGDATQQARYLPAAAIGHSLGAVALTEPNAGSNPADMRTRATREGDGFRLKDRKCFISNGGVADFLVVYAVTDPDAAHRGISAVVVDKGTPGLVPGRIERTMGPPGGHVWELDLDLFVPAQNRVGPEGTGFRTAMKVLDNGRVEVAAMCIGIAQQAYDLAVEWSGSRLIGGVALASRQGIRWQLADMATDLQAARLLALEAARLRHVGQRFTQAAAMAKLFASEMVGRITDAALQIHGGIGFTRNFPLERLGRDCRIMRIFEGSLEIQRNIIASHLPMRTL